jgi:hypothetical protein
VEGVHPGDRAEEQHADRVEVGAVIHIDPFDLLGRHAVRAAEDQAGAGDALVVLGELHKPEIDDLDRLLAALVGADEQVAGLEVAVDHAALVGVAEGRAHLKEQGNRLARGHRAALEHVGEARAVHELHREPVPTILSFTEVM